MVIFRHVFSRERLSTESKQDAKQTWTKQSRGVVKARFGRMTFADVQRSSCDTSTNASTTIGPTRLIWCR